MPCLYFEPQQVARSGQDLQGRLPLCDEYEGLCHACVPAQPVPLPFRFCGCNQGQSDSGCMAYPPGASRRQRRFHLRGAKSQGDEGRLEILVVEIESHTPLRSYSVSYSKADERLEPETQDECERAQLLAFCRSYLRRFPGPASSSVE